ncbi:site-specific integrase [Enterococcus casseliflavus]|uniref:site-specific integrase n=1 Tax=Enterococcus casseliflavus TaxID=37734 RepID=UPI0022E8EA59|nr:site-specific integrase [Enterococcus casseliflavus]
MIKQYTKKDGSKWWMFKAYLGIDPGTGKKLYTTRRGFKTQKEAKIAKARLETEAQDNKYAPEKNYTFIDIQELWYEEYKHTVRESTLSRVSFLFKKNIFPCFGKKKISSFTVAYCQKTVNKWKAEYSTYKALKTYTTAVFDYAVRMNVIVSNPMKDVYITKGNARKKEDKIKFYEAEELKEFLEVAKKDKFPLSYPLFRLLAFTGIRKGEALALTWQDIDFENKILTINKTIARNTKNELVTNQPKTETSNREISLDDTTIEVLKKWRQDQRKYLLSHGHNSLRPNQIIFSSKNNNYLDPLRPNNIQKRLCRESGLKDITIHGFRHTHCSLLFEAGLSIQEVQSRLGHSDIQTTMNIYAHVTKKQKDSSAQRFANYINF